MKKEKLYGKQPIQHFHYMCLVTVIKHIDDDHDHVICIVYIGLYIFLIILLFNSGRKIVKRGYIYSVFFFS